MAGLANQMQGSPAFAQMASSPQMMMGPLSFLFQPGGFGSGGGMSSQPGPGMQNFGSWMGAQGQGGGGTTSGGLK